MDPVNLLHGEGVQVVVGGGLGRGPLAGFGKLGIPVYSSGEARTVADAVTLLASGKASEIDDGHACGGGGCGHHHEPVVRDLVEGPVALDRVPTLAYTLTNDAGEVLDSSESLAYLHGRGQLIPGLEKHLEGRVAGDEIEVTIPPEDAYGVIDPARRFDVPLTQLPEGVQVGMTLHARLENGNQVPLRVAAIVDDKATMDANHPLAGETLHFKVSVVKVEAAAAEELAHGHVH